MHLRLFLILIACLSLAPAATVPSGFAETQIATGLDPSAMAFAPDGRLFVLEKPGKVRVIKNNALLATPFLDMVTLVDNFNERGLIGLAFHPQFASNGWLYLYYTAKTPATHNRVIRITANGDVAVANSTVAIIELTNLSTAGNHNGGPMAFGSDGKLYVATGENANGAHAQNPANLLGKLLRLNDDGSIPGDNPTPGSAIFCLGLRNPFGLAVQPGTGRMFLNDVGAGSWEEINEVIANANFGWSTIEGKRTSQTAPANYRDPIQTYDHGVGYCITGGAFYNPANPGIDAFPTAYAGRYFFCDYGGWIKWIDPAAPGTRNDFISGAARPIGVAVAADGALWYLARAGIGGGSNADNTSSTNGSVWRVRSTIAPVATKLAFVQQPTATGAGTIITPAVRVAVQDANSATVTNATASITLSLSSGTLGGTVTVAAVNGIATFPNLTVAAPANGLTLTATSNGLTGATSAAFNSLAQTATPIISPGTRTYSGPVWVQLSCATPNATIRYTTDGSAPNTASTVYSAPFQRTGTTIVRAIAVATGLTSSAEASATMTISGTTAYGLATRPQVTGITVPNTAAAAPTTLSGTGLFTNLSTLAPRAGVIPYDVNSPLWSDGAAKQRWVALPGAATIGFAATGEWTWPQGTIFVKHFALGTRRLETRILHVAPGGGASYGITYRWRSDNLDADLVGVDGQSEDVGGGQTWSYPSRSQCLQCHTVNAGTVLGPSTRQLNGSYAYPGGATDNQLRTWNYLQMFSNDIGEASIATFTRLVAVSDLSASLENRTRSYLDANCSFCHRPGGTPAAFDARWETPLSRQGLIDGAVRDTLGVAGAKVVVPQDLPRSILHARLSSNQPSQRMPPVGRSVVDQVAVDTVGQWIRSLPSGTGLQGEYWTNQDKTFDGPPSLSRIDSTVNFNWGTGSPGTGISPDRFTARWSGAVQAAFTETYTFSVRVDDGVRLRVGDTVVIDRWVDQAPTTWTGVMALTAGQQVPLVLEFYEKSAGAEISLSWSSPSTPLEIIPTHRLFPTVPGLLQARINFQPRQSPAPAGYLIDSGAIFGERGNGLAYGWTVDLADTLRDRNLNADQRLDTLIHLQKNPQLAPVWELAVPNGWYQVQGSSGDPGFFDGVYQTSVEGVLAISGTPTSAQRWISTPNGGIRVRVTDGRLTVGSAPGARNNKLNYLDISRVPTVNQ